MGTVLAMRCAILAAMLGAGLLAGCDRGGAAGNAGRADPAGAPEAEGRVLGAVNAAANLIFGSDPESAGSGPGALIPGAFTPEAVAADPSAYRIIQINALGLNELGRVIQDNGEEITIALQSGPTAAFDQGVLTATRGFGDDLLTIDAPGLLPILRAGGGTLTRTVETLDSQDRIVTSRFTCTVTPAGTETLNLGLREASLRRLDENCRGERIVFDNIYWLDTRGEIVASRQYVSPTVAYLRASRL
ncbi:hypothetical protein ruthe_03131 [Rubellimicrobium thermophilum DSM 16684]|uniref:Group 4 capsule polysaccharide formation lipoprotein gfcB n=2 Tax=Rubellimicrobium TaxID=295418 RepID=S9QSP6_9RHOB|nr:hypothetical protein ruthe_03131 [Rubellimicrobium thermophilum DSM 16684]